MRPGVTDIHSLCISERSPLSAPSSCPSFPTTQLEGLPPELRSVALEEVEQVSKTVHPFLSAVDFFRVGRQRKSTKGAVWKLHQLYTPRSKGQTDWQERRGERTPRGGVASTRTMPPQPPPHRTTSHAPSFRVIASGRRSPLKRQHQRRASSERTYHSVSTVDSYPQMLQDVLQCVDDGLD